MLDAARCRRIIAASFPEIEIETPRYFAEGWDYELWEIEGGLLFRFPKRAETADPLRREARLLARLAGVLSVPIPRPLYVSEGNRQFPQPFFGYAKLPGTPLEDVPPSKASRTPLVKALADFLEELHGVPPATAAAWGVPCYTADAWREWYRGFRETVRRGVLHRLSNAEQAAVESFWRGFLDNDRHFRFEPVLIHADLSPEHILVDGAGEQITGIIDFDDAMVGDPALDITGFDDALQAMLVDTCAGALDDTAIARTHYYRKFSAFHSALYGLRIGDRARVDTALERIRREIVLGDQAERAASPVDGPDRRSLR